MRVKRGACFHNVMMSTRKSLSPNVRAEPSAREAKPQQGNLKLV